MKLSENQHDIKGRLRFSMPPNFEPLWPLLDRVQAKYKIVEIDLFITER